MGLTLGLHVGETFWEAAINAEGNLSSKRWYLPHRHITEPLKSFFDDNGIQKESIDSVLLTTKIASQILHKRMGTSPAFLVTAGLEHWLDMSVPIKPRHFTLAPEKAETPLLQDFVFGVSERTNPSGEVEKAVDLNDIEFLVAKLQMNNITHVAVGFTHSHANSSNEKKVAAFLRDKGFHVFASHTSHSEFGDNSVFQSSERWRWWRAVLNAYSQASFQEVIDEIRVMLGEAIGKEFSLSIGNSDGTFEEANSIEPLSSSRGHTAQLAKIQSTLPNKGEVIYFGLEDFLLFPSGDQQGYVWRSEFGPVAMKTPLFHRTKIQPTQLLTKSFWGTPEFSADETGYEPGPICMGKGFKPTFLDLMFLRGQLVEVDGLAERLKEKSTNKILDELLAYSREAHDLENVRPHAIPEWLYEIAIMSLAAEIEQRAVTNNIFCTGPLAPALVEPLKGLLTKNLILDDHYGHSKLAVSSLEIQ